MNELTVVVKRNSFTPADAWEGYPPLIPIECSKVNVSVVFTEDIKNGRQIALAWGAKYGDVYIGGPAFGDPGGEFEPGKFIKKGVTITSRGCSRKCPECYVPKREGEIRELKIHEGNIIQDNNLLACSKGHIQDVFEMLETQRAIEFKGGIDPRLLEGWHIEAFKKLKIKEIWLSADHPNYQKASTKAIKALRREGFGQHKIRCYVMVGKNETMRFAESRLKRVYHAGADPFAQLWDKYNGDDKKEWEKFARRWSRPAAYRTMIKHKLANRRGMSECQKTG